MALFLSLLLTLPLFSGAPITTGLPQINLAGKPAPAPSAAVAGLVLVAHDSGPQAVFTEQPSSCVVSLQAGEDFQIAIPIRGATGEITVSLEAALLEPGEVEIVLDLNNTVIRRRISTIPQRVLVSLSPTGGEGRGEGAAKNETILKIHLGPASRTTTVRLQNLQFTIGNQTTNLTLFPGSGNVDECPARVLPPLRPALEQALIEWDWRMQDGIGTARAPRTYAQALEQLWPRGEALLRDLELSGGHTVIQAVRWQELRRQSRDLSAAAIPNDDPRWEDLWRRAHQARREIAFANPLANIGPIAFVKQVPSMFSHQLTQYYGSCARPGGGVYVLEKPGQSMAARQLATGALPLGSYQHLDVSPGGDKLLFAYCEAPTVPRDREQHLDRFYHLYEIAANGTGLRQLTQGPYDDFSPRYLPDGRLLFISTRRGGFHRCGRGPCATYTLAVAEADGSNPHPISFHETHEWDPAVLHDGRIVYTRWDYVDRHAVHYEQLWTVRPDGSDVRALYGNNTFNPVGVWEAQPIPGSTRIMATAAAHHAMTAGSIILLDPARGLEGLEPITRLTPDALFPESEAPVVMKPNGVWHAPAGVSQPPPLPPEAVRWPGHCYRSPSPLSEKYFLAAYSFDALIGEPTWNRANMFGLYLVDAFGNKELLYRDLNIASLWPVPLRARPAMVQAAATADFELKTEGTFFLQNVYASWPALPREEIKRLRIVQVLPKSTPHANTPTVGLANASPGKQILGTVPVEADGSAYFRAPAGIPLAFQALDARGQAVQIMRSLTYLQPGERAACIGCHESRDTAPPPGRPALAARRAPSVIAPAPDGANPLSYPLLVQPVLDRKCVSCHNAAKAEGKVLLTGEPQGRYTVSYNALAPRVPFSAWGGKDGDFRIVNREPLSVPDFFGARGSKLMQQLVAGAHYEVKLDAEEIERLATWMDVNALFYGTFDPADQAKQQLGQRIAGPKIQ